MDQAVETKCAISNVKLPTKAKCPGRPKGAALTPIGLPKKRAISKPIAFAKKHFKIKENIIIEWLT